MRRKEFFGPTKKKLFVVASLILLLILSYVIYYKTQIWMLKLILNPIMQILAFPSIIFLRIFGVNIITIAISAIVGIIYLYLLSSLPFLPYKKMLMSIFSYLHKNWLSLLIATIIIPILLWFSSMAFLTNFLIWGQYLAFVAIMPFTIILYKITEKMLKLQKLGILLVIFLSIIGYILSWQIFYLMPECGSSLLTMMGSRTVECSCTGIKITIDTSLAMDYYTTKTICLGYGKSSSPKEVNSRSPPNFIK